tara:strand:+ start:2784 stop:3155 length:372 start_codon:yes stop_codon:yes gene_type:complete
MEYRQIQVSPRTAAIGADVDGVDLGNIDDSTFAEVKSALHEHLVLFFHDQQLTPEAHMALASRIGEMEVHEVLAVRGSSRDFRARTRPRAPADQRFLAFRCHVPAGAFDGVRAARPAHPAEWW